MKIRFVMPRLSYIAMIILLFSANSFADTSADCNKIKNSTKRLACFDNQQKGKIQLANEEKARIEEEKKKSEFLSAAQTCLSALRKLEAKVSTGISYRDYYTPLADLKYEIESFVRSSNNDYNKEFSNHIIKAWGHYQMAGEIWSIKFSGRYVNDDMAITQELVNDYPQSSSYTSSVGNIQIIKYNRMLSIIWGAAKDEIDSAEKAMNPTP